MIIEILINFLIGKTGSQDVYAEVPENAPDEFWTIEQTGSDTRNRITTTTIAIQSWADSMLRAAEMNEEIKEAMERLPEIKEVSACRLNSDYNFTNTAKKKYRYQAVYDITTH